METRAEALRLSKVKNAVGRPPKLGALLGAMLLTETDWSPDHRTAARHSRCCLGEDGVKLINEYTVPPPGP